MKEEKEKKGRERKKFSKTIFGIFIYLFVFFFLVFCFFGARSQSPVQFLYIPFLYVQSLYSFGRGAGGGCLRGVVSVRASASHLSLFSLS
jgi:hypothetical protein